jgi:hypothetical protein
MLPLAGLFCSNEFLSHAGSTSLVMDVEFFNIILQILRKSL